MIKRTLSPFLQQLAHEYPVVTVVGPRQSGKSTLCQASFPNLPVVNLELPDLRMRANHDPKAFIAGLRGGCIIDEIQYFPELTSYIQVAVDERKSKGEFIITGSQQYQLMQSVSQSLAGRTAILRLLPLSQTELSDSKLIPSTVDAQMFFGGYPRIFNDSLNPSQALSYYVQTYLERDVRQIINVRDLTLFQKFLRLCAARSGQLLNATNLANEAGINQSTVREWLSALEASFILIRVQPHHNNLSKRILKSPKLYFLDTGLLCFLLGIQSPEQLSLHPLRGAIFETYVASELVKHFYNQAQDCRLYFFRDSAGHAVDFILDNGLSVRPIEVKSSSTYSTSFLSDLNYYCALPGTRTITPTIIYTGTETFSTSGIEVVSISALNKSLEGAA